MNRHSFAALLTGLALSLTLLHACVPPPASTDTLDVTASTLTAELRFGARAELLASASGGTRPYLFRWEYVDGPDGVEDPVSNPLVQTLRTDVLNTAGDYTFRVVARDAAEGDAVDFITITVLEPTAGDIFEVSIVSPSTATLNEDVALTASTDFEGAVTYAWEVVEGQATITPDDAAEVTFRGTALGQTSVRLTMTSVATEEATFASAAVNVVESGAFTVDIDGPTSVGLDSTNELATTVNNGGENLTYAWEILAGPGSLDVTDQPAVNFIAGEQGDTTVSVAVTDTDTEEVVQAQLVVTTSEMVDEIPAFAFNTNLAYLVGSQEDVQIPIDLVGVSEENDLAFQWEVVSGGAAIDDPTDALPIITGPAGGTSVLRFSTTVSNGTGASRTESTLLYIVVATSNNPEVIFDFEGYGEVRVELDGVNTPTTTANFLSYVDEGFYDGLVIHRIESGSFGVVQGGGFLPEAAPDYSAEDQVETHGSILNEAEFGGSNVRGTIAMARTNDPDSATSQFFFNTSDNSASLDFGSPGGNAAGFAVFGTVVEGLDVLDTMSEEVPTQSRSGLNFVTEPVLMTVRRN